MSERVWDKFLTPQDKAHLTKKNSHQSVGFGQKPGILLVDLYRAVFGDRPQPLLDAIEEWPQSCGMAAWDAVPHIQELLSVARGLEIPVTHVTMLTNTGVEGWGVPRGRRPGQRQRAMNAVGSPDAMHEIIPEVGPILGEAVIRKASPSAFWGTPLIAHLNVQEVDTLIVVGESTSGCVRATVIDACTYRFKVIIAEEGVFDRHEAPHAINLFDLDQKYADVLPTAEVISMLKQWREDKDAVEGKVKAASL
ncbi:MAG: isochorismatase family protein [Dehalococcoidia bacterium]|nr:isochorismatase family protein [Dehalococcoidia bacterium]